MMNRIWGILMILSIVVGTVTGRVEAVASAAMTGAADGVELFLSILGMMCLWSGLMSIAAQSGLTRLFSLILSPLLRFLFPDVEKGSETAGALSMSMAANFLGLGSAATPLGLRAMSLLAEKSPPGEASDSMVTLVVLNTASIQLIPTTIAMYRAAAGSSSPLSILPCVWISSICSVTVGIVMTKLFSRLSRRQVFSKKEVAYGSPG